MTLKHQEQLLQRDLGVPADLLYRAYSYSAWPGNAKYVGVGDFTHAFPLYFESMSARANLCSVPTYLGYQVFDSTTNPIPKFNYCRNQKLRLVCHAIGNWQEYSYHPTYGYSCTGAPYYKYALPVGTVVPTVPELIDWSLSASASNRAWWSMQPRFQGDFDGLNFLFELKDFKNIAKHIAALRPSKITETLKHAQYAIRRADRAVRNGSTSRRLFETANAATRLASEVVLIKHFAIDPTVKDLLSLHGQLQQLVSDVQHRFREKGETANRRHFSEKIREVDSTITGTKTSSWQKRGTLLTDEFTATMEFSYDYKMRGTMDALKRYYGLELNAGVVWNGLPFSFLVDYFVKVGDAIEQMTVDPNVVLDFHQYCESRLVTVRSGMMFNGSVDTKYNWATIINGQIAHNQQMITGYEGTLYERRVVPPKKGMALPRIKLPSTKQALNIAALVRCMW